ncbi:hypothetical protein Clacol_004788 [Clathrus columnatus]|uniref:ABC1 atypical kinase-like domain-containing protein n=1 Tax=Clathrus columnatus TaxID=1419009 RepID=A0AAV5A7F8_9AGAM|nr:hypothetical protein Clacol_004788 [Clathrus columnatus]
MLCKSMPNEFYNWYCVFHSLAVITRHAANIRINTSYSSSFYNKRRRLDTEFDLHWTPPTPSKPSEEIPKSQKTSNKDSEPFLAISHEKEKALSIDTSSSPDSLVGEKSSDASPIPSESPSLPIITPPPLRSSRVPSSRLGRFVHYGGLAASLSFGAATEIIRRTSGGQVSNDTQNTSVLMTEANLNRLVSKLSKMRGAALKMGQFMSIQDTQVLSEDLERVFRRVQDAAHYMPNSQLENVMSEDLGESWESHFSFFPRIPSHAASIGQVHLAILSAKSSPTGKEEEVAIKVQFPNIENSISSDLGYLKLLLGASMLLPKGLFLDSTIKVFKEELADECNYKREAEYINKYRALSPKHLDSRYRIPWVWEMSTRRVLVMERMKGVSVGGDVVKTLTQEERNEIELIDFGATREYSSEFTDNWLRLLQAAISSDRQECIEASLKLKYFIGGENEAMTNAHILSMQLLGTPFRPSTVQPFPFARGSEWTRITDEIRSQVPIMLNNRLTPPPRETYSLNRKLSGAFLLAGRLGASVDCRKIWERVVEKRYP